MTKGLTVCSILVAHERPTGLDLGIHNSIPQLLGGHGLTTTTLLLVLLIERLELVPVNFMQTGSLIRRE